jgi:aryl-alcohol dehydrogenase-like predicted oxidoreductase
VATAPHKADRIADGSRLVLGTAQFGMPYGVTNRHGKVSEAAAAQILSTACDAGISMIDTAAGYGTSEAVLGKCLAGLPEIGVITKTLAFPGDKITAADAGALRTNLECSLKRLDRRRVEALLIHHGSDVLKPGGDRLLEMLASLKASGLTARIGVSVYDAADLDGVLEKLHPDVVQLPLNLFDQRLVRSGHIERMKAAGIEIHARSIFLQGILLADTAGLPAYFSSFSRQFASYAKLLERAGLRPLQACLGFVLKQSGADRAVVGVTGTSDLQEILSALATMPASLPDMSAFATDDLALIDPRRWRTG